MQMFSIMQMAVIAVIAIAANVLYGRMA